MQPVRRCNRLGRSVLEKLQLMMKALDGPDTLTLAKAVPCAGRQNDHPQHRHESQQDHYRHSPTTYLRSRPKSLLSRSFEVVDGGEMHSADLVGTSPLGIDL